MGLNGARVSRVSGVATRAREGVGELREFCESPRAREQLQLSVPPEFLEQLAERVAELLADRQAAAVPDPYLTVDEAARYLACKPKRVYDLCSQRRIPFCKDGSRTLLRRADLDAYLEDHPA